MYAKRMLPRYRPAQDSAFAAALGLASPKTRRPIVHGRRVFPFPLDGTGPP